MHRPRRTAPALAAGTLLLALLIAALPAGALAAPSVSVRVEGLSETRLPLTQVTLGTAPVSNDGNPEHTCPAASALAALNGATHGAWSGPWNAKFRQYEVFSIDAESHVFEPGAPANYFWSFWLDEKESEVGACEAEVHAGDRILFFPSCYGSACPPPLLPLGVEAPASAAVGEAVQVTVKRYGAEGKGTPLAGATVAGGSSTVTTDSSGHAGVTFSAPGQATLRISAPASVRTEAEVCVHQGADGTCGTAAAPPLGPVICGCGVMSRGVSLQMRGVIDGHTYPARRAPRSISGTALSASPVTAVDIGLRRSYRGRCYAYAGARGFRRARCGRAVTLRVGSGSSFRYRFAHALPPGRYVLEVRAVNAVGDHSAPARGHTVFAFDVR